MKDERHVTTTVDEALHNAKDQGADFVNAEEYVEGEVPVAETPIFAEAANQEVPVEESVVEDVVEEGAEQAPVFTTDYTAFDEASEFAQPEGKKGNLLPIIGMLVAFVFLLGVCFFAISSKDGSIKSFLRLDPTKEETTKKAEDTNLSREIEEPQEETPIEEPQMDEQPAEEQKQNKPSGSSSSNSSSHSDDDNYDFDLNNGNNSGSSDKEKPEDIPKVEESKKVKHYAYLELDNGYAYPKQKIKKHELAKMLCLYNNVDVDKISAGNPYSDVTSSTPNFKYILAATHLGYFEPLVNTGSFNPNEELRRDEAVAIMVHLADMKGITSPSFCSSGVSGVEFKDLDSSPYKDAVAKIGRLCIAAGDGHGNFKPDGKIQRGHFAFMFGRIMDRDKTYSSCPTMSNPFKDVGTGEVIYRHMLDAFFTRDCDK